ncbi:NADP+-dependent D-mannitol dehydrogenase [Heliocybe sulcata]|uniref:NADP+-dependent D-mannitol dehydrogenase n=1 Tax=Heliocybe sulcata TaxID=5364 RepID=A0A5C3N9A7_9AGAM|nr:NADP+-dependent D-mannitol dehydrogenase [Heliocybe sulcata]
MTPAQMKAVVYSAPSQFSVREEPVPRPAKGQILIKVSCVGVCGSDGHIHAGEFPVLYPLIPGHEVMGTVHSIGEGVDGYMIGDRCVVEPVAFCGQCFFCRRGNHVMCLNLGGHGVTFPGGFAEYMLTEASRVFKIKNLTDEEAVLIEPTSCALHAIDRLKVKVGAEALVIGAGPSGMMLAQLLKLNGASKVVVVAPAGRKMEVARRLEAGDEYVELDRSDSRAGWAKVKREYPRGFDVVVEMTGSEAIINDAINYVRRGGSLMIYSLYPPSALVHWPPSKIFADEIEILGSMAQAYCFPRAVEYIESRKVKTQGVVTDIFKLDEWEKVLEKMESRDFVKIAVKV